MRIFKYMWLALAVAVAMPTVGNTADLGGMKDDSQVGGSDTPLASYPWAGIYVGGHVGYGWGNFSGTQGSANSVSDFSLSRCKKSGETTVYGLSELVCETKEGFTYHAPRRSDDTFTEGRYTELDGYAARSHAVDEDMDSFFGGVGVSYKVQPNNSFIVEPFADVSIGGGSFNSTTKTAILKYTDEDGAVNDIDKDALFGVDDLSVDKKWGATLGIKVGALPTKRDYVYGLAGLAYGRFDIKGGSVIVENNASGNLAADAPKASYNESLNEWGYTLGAGWERALTRSWHVGVEGRYTVFGDLNAEAAKMASVFNKYGDYTSKSRGHDLANSSTVSGDYEEWSVLGRVSYKIGERE